MAEVRITYHPTQKSIGTVVVDAFLSETYQFDNDVTEIPVEEGVNVTDHVVEKPVRIQISAFIGQAEFAAYTGEIPSDLQSLNGIDKKQRIMQMYKELRKIKSDKKPVTVVMGLDTFKNMVVTSFNIGRDAETGADLSFDMSLTEVKIITSQSVEINSAQISQTAPGGAGDQAAPATSRGNAAKKEEPYGSEIWRQANANVDSMGLRPGDYVGLP
jgi:hypothetical protein